MLIEWMNINFPDNSSLKHFFLWCFHAVWVSVECFFSHSFRFVLTLYRMYIFCFVTLRWIVLYILDCFSTDMTSILSMHLLVITLDRSPCWNLNRAPVQLLPPLKDMKVGCVITAVFHPICVHVCLLSRFILLWLFATLWTVALQAPLSMGILQARILEWVAMLSSRGSSWFRDRTRVSYISCIGRWFLYHQHHLGSPFHPIWASKSSSWLCGFMND